MTGSTIYLLLKFFCCLDLLLQQILLLWFGSVGHAKLCVMIYTHQSTWKTIIFQVIMATNR